MPVLVGLGTIVLIAVGSRYVLIAGWLLLGLAISLILVTRSSDPAKRGDDDERR